MRERRERRSTLAVNNSQTSMGDAEPPPDDEPPLPPPVLGALTFTLLVALLFVPSGSASLPAIDTL